MDHNITAAERQMAAGALTWLTTQPEAAAACLDLLGNEPPFVYRDVSGGFYGIAKHYGGMKALGHEYLYVQEADACIRLDVVRTFISIHGDDSQAASGSATVAASAP